MPLPALWIVIVNWNGGALTRDALASAEAGRRLPDGVVIVDNGSADDSVDLALTVRPDAEVVRNDENRGFAAAANQGMRRARERGAEHLFLLNPDARLEEDTLDQLTGALERHPRGGLFAGKILFEGTSSPPRIWCAGVDVGFHPNLQDLRGFGDEDRGQFDREEVVPALTGCGLLIRGDVLAEIGDFDEDFFVYVEDLDLSLRAAAAGWSAVYVPDARMHHQAGAATGGGYGAWRKEQLAFNLVRFLKKRGSVRLWWSWLVLDVLSWPFLLVVNLVRGRGGATLAKGRGMIRGLFGLSAPQAPRS